MTNDILGTDCPKCKSSEYSHHSAINKRGEIK